MIPNFYMNFMLPNHIFNFSTLVYKIGTIECYSNDRAYVYRSTTKCRNSFKANCEVAYD